MTRQGNKGFSLVELMVALAVAAILLVAAGPSFRDAIRRNKVSSASNALLADIAYARSEAINRGNVVSICPSSDQATCTGNGKAYENGWLVYTYQAGKGVALARHVIASQEISTGELVRLFDVVVPSEDAHYFVHLPEGLEKPGVAAFKEWIFEEMRLFHASAAWPG